VKYLSFHNSSFAFRYFLNVNGTPLVPYFPLQWVLCLMAFARVSHLKGIEVYADGIWQIYTVNTS